VIKNTVNQNANDSHSYPKVPRYHYARFQTSRTIDLKENRTFIISKPKYKVNPNQKTADDLHKQLHIPLPIDKSEVQLQLHKRTKLEKKRARESGMNFK